MSMICDLSVSTALPGYLNNTSITQVEEVLKNLDGWDIISLFKLM